MCCCRAGIPSAGGAIVLSPAWSEAECREQNETRWRSPGGTIDVVSSRAMPDSYVANRVHCVFGTKDRRKIIPAEMQPRLWSFMAGIARCNGITPLAIGGFDDAHVLIALPATVALAKAVQLIEAGSSKWCNQNFADGQFQWQAGYAAFSVSASMLAKTQAIHSRTSVNITVTGISHRSGRTFSTRMDLSSRRL